MESLQGELFGPTARAGCTPSRSTWDWLGINADANAAARRAIRSCGKASHALRRTSSLPARELTMSRKRQSPVPEVINRAFTPPLFSVRRMWARTSFSTASATPHVTCRWDEHKSRQVHDCTGYESGRTRSQLVEKTAGGRDRDCMEASDVY